MVYRLKKLKKTQRLSSSESLRREKKLGKKRYHLQLLQHLKPLQP
jgi:hypothetical protein